jgi:hypothetical protein
MVQNFTIYGERCSGTKFLERSILKYTNLKPTWDFGWKHFFGFNDEQILYEGDNTLFLAIVRNPYQWLMSLNRKRHHIEGGKHKKDFFTDEWKSCKTKTIGSREIMEDRNPMNGERYKNIFELRKYKCRYLWYELPLYAKNNYFIRYEDLLENNIAILNHIVFLFDIPIKANSQIEPVVHGRKYFIDDDNFQLFNNNIDWSTENTIGYKKIENQDF